jgi:hypothetical protein
MKNKGTRVEVLAQYIDENGKKKGGQTFVFYVKDTDVFLYAPTDLIRETLQTMLDNFCKDSYVYVSHELLFCEPIMLTDNFQELIQKIHDSKI